MHGKVVVTMVDGKTPQEHTFEVDSLQNPPKMTVTIGKDAAQNLRLMCGSAEWTSKGQWDDLLVMVMEIRRDAMEMSTLGSKADRESVQLPDLATLCDTKILFGLGSVRTGGKSVELSVVITSCGRVVNTQLPPWSEIESIVLEIGE